MNDSTKNYYMSEFALGEEGCAPHKHIIWQEESTANVHLCNTSYPISMVEQDVKIKYLISLNPLTELTDTVVRHKFH